MCLDLRCGDQTTCAYDPVSQVTNILHQLTATSTPINQAAYLYSPVGNRTQLTDRRGTQTFGYDNLDRLTSASHPLLATPQAFAYDPVGNRTTGGSVVNSGNQLTADAIHSYQYDDNGNLTRKTLLATGNFTAYTYDAENRLTKVEDFVAGNPTPAFTSTYRYDGLGRRIEKVAGGQTKRYVYDGEDILLEYDGANVLQARYTHGPGIDEPIAVTKGGSTFFYHQDGLGTVTDLTDSTGVTAKSYSYDAYGNIVEQTGTVEQPYTYTGREFDQDTGLYYYRARYYDATTGRFLQQDPLKLGGGSVNLYGYVLNSPANFIDPSGLFLERVFCGPRNSYSNMSISAEEFVEHVGSRSLRDLQYEYGSSNAPESEAGGPHPKKRYVRDPADPNSVIDMRHFLVVGKQGELFGLGVEIGQALSSNPDARSSAFDPQDFYSNALGANFFASADPSQNFRDQLRRFFAKRKHVACPLDPVNSCK